VRFGASLLGVLGALVAVPVAASIQIAAREYMDLRGIRPRRPDPEEPPPPDTPPPPSAGAGEPGAATA
jgi:predicted PurR-regulated permease PerM